MTTVAIDFGTSNTVVSIMEADTALPKTLRFSAISRLLKLGKGKENITEISVIPTLAFVKNQDNIIIGEKVRSQRLGMAQPHRLFKGFKRELSADFQAPPRQIEAQQYTAETIAEAFIKEIWHNLQKEEINPSKVIFTAPVGAFERYLDWFRALGNSLEIEKIQLIDESTAAALGYAVKRPNSLVLVIDFGGGTLDLSLVKTFNPNALENADNLKAQVIAKTDAYVGGEDIDNWILEDYLAQIGTSREEIDPISWQNLLEIAEKLKIKLSDEELVKESWLDENTFMSYEISLNREKLEQILENHLLLEQLREALDEVITIALSKGIKKNEIEQVLLVGGTCLIPAIQQLIKLYFGKNKVKLEKPFEAVCHGALTLENIIEIDDYLRHSYAIRLWDNYQKTHNFYPLFTAGIKYPCEREESLILQVVKNEQTTIRLDVGELGKISQAEVTYDSYGRMSSQGVSQKEIYRSLECHHGEVCLAHLDPPGMLGMDRLSVDFAVDENRVLLATVKDLFTDKILVEKQAIAKLN
jgi:molecular chaperone DnaK (HSP70)